MDTGNYRKSWPVCSWLITLDLQPTFISISTWPNSNTTPFFWCITCQNVRLILQFLTGNVLNTPTKRSCQVITCMSLARLKLPSRYSWLFVICHIIFWGWGKYCLRCKKIYVKKTTKRCNFIIVIKLLLLFYLFSFA